MPRRKKRPVELPTDEALRKLFPKPVREEMKKTARESKKKGTRRDSS
jgi:hypothetical protein